MANQPKKYKKFVATAATATLVASAIVPVASAADSKFSDMSNYDAETIALVEDLAAKGIVSGDGNLFKPQGEVSRKHAVLMIGRFLKENGVKGSGEAKQFDDVSSADAEFAELALLVRDLGIFEGNDGKLNPSAKLSRENMALVMDRVYKQITGKSMVETAKDKGLTGSFTDASSIKEEARAAALAAKALGLSKADAFNPKGSAKRVHFAQFFYVALPTLEEALKTPPTKEELEAAQKAVEDAVKELPALSSITKENAADAKAKAEAVNKAVKDAEELLAKAELTDAEKEAAQKALDAAKEAAKAVTDQVAEVTKPVVGLAVESVSAINAQEIQVTFNQEVDSETALELANYNLSVNSANVALSASTLTNVDAAKATHLTTASLSKDGKVVTFVLTTKLDNGDTYTIDVKDGVLTKDGKSSVERFGQAEKKFNDTVAPSAIKEVKFDKTSGAEELVVYFDEPIAAALGNATNGSDTFAVTVDGKEIKFDTSAGATATSEITAANAAITNGIGQYTLTISTAALTAAGVNVSAFTDGEHTVKVYNARDIVSNNGFGGNKSNILTGTYKVQDVSVAPQFVGITPVDFNTFRVEFNTPVTDATIDVFQGTTKFYGASNVTASTYDAKKDVYYTLISLPVNVLTPSTTAGLTPLYAEGAKTTAITVRAEDFKNSNGVQATATKTLNGTLTRDDVAPKAVGTTSNTLIATAAAGATPGTVDLFVKLNRSVDAPSGTTFVASDLSTQVGSSDYYTTLAANGLSADLNTVALTDAAAKLFSKVNVKDEGGISRTVTGLQVVYKLNTTTNKIDKYLQVTVPAQPEAGQTLDEYIDKQIPYTVNVGAGVLSVETDIVELTGVPKDKNNNPYNATDHTNKLNNDAFSTVVNQKASNVVDHYAVEGVTAVTSSGTNTNVITVEYKQKMDSKTATNAANYQLDGKVLPAGSSVTIDANNMIVTITLPDATYVKDINVPLTISTNVKTATGSYIVGNIQNKTAYNSPLLIVKDNVAPTIAGAKFVLAKGTDKTSSVLELTFSEAIDNSTIAATLASLESIVVKEGNTAVTAYDVVAKQDDNGLYTKAYIVLGTSSTALSTVNIANNVTIQYKADTNGALVVEDAADNKLKPATVKATGTSVDNAFYGGL